MDRKPLLTLTLHDGNVTTAEASDEWLGLLPQGFQGPCLQNFGFMHIRSVVWRIG